MRSCSLRISISRSRLDAWLDLNGSRTDDVPSAGVVLVDFKSDDDDFASTAGWGAALIGFIDPSDELLGLTLRSEGSYISSNSLRIQTVAGVWADARELAGKCPSFPTMTWS